jgi:uncharacterized membrane protein (UPF0127 family)
MESRRYCGSALLASLALLALTACDKPAPSVEPVVDLSLPRQAQPRLQTVQLWLGPEQITAEMAVTVREIMTGMMFRTNMAESEGMIFDLGPPQRAHFWMKNCYVPLSVAYIDPDGAILEIHDLQPQNTNTVDSVSDDVTYALEMRQGWFQRHNIQPGVVVRSERGSLAETFGRPR